MSALAVHLLVDVAPSVWLPESASTAAGEHDALFRLLLLVGGTVAALVILAIDIVLVMNLRQDAEHTGRAVKTPSSTVFFVGLAGLLLAGLVFVTGFRGRADAVVAPADAYAIRAHASNGGWTFTYVNAVETDTLHVPQGEPVSLALSSDAGVKNLWIPEFRLRETIVAGAGGEAWFHAEAAGTYPLVGTALDGTPIDSLATEVVVHEGAGFREWLMKASNPLETYPLPEAGRILANRNGCFVCHSIDGTPGTAPSFLGLLTRSRTFEGGGSLAVADSNYVRESILTPQAKVVAGFQPVMPSFDGKLGDPEIGAILEYFRSIDAAAEEAGS